MVPDEAHFASAVDFKAPIRAEIERIGYTIIANMGEQPPTCSAELATELKNRGAVTGRMKHYAGNSRAS
jgi:hypothetical protein